MKILMLKFERLLLTILMNFGELLSDITPAWKMRKLHLWFYHEIHGNAFRKILKLDKKIYELEAKTWYCNSCGNVVFKGNVKSIVLNCPHCKKQFTVFYESPHKFKKRKLTQSSKSGKIKFNGEKLEIEWVNTDTEIKGEF